MPTLVGAGGARWFYDKRRRLGEPGGFGDVYEGSGLEGSPVAVKIIRGPGAGGHAPRALRARELEIVGALTSVRSDYLVPVLDTGTFNGNHFVVMPRADATLASVISRRLDHNVALGVLRDVTTGLVDLHAAGILHRDLKPANVLRWKDQWRLADFGMARDVKVGRGAYTFARAFGTPPYMAPEVWRGESPSPQTDLYSLGCLAFELLSGTPPFGHVTDLERLRHCHLKHRPDPVTAAQPVASLISDLLRKRPGDRPISAIEVRDRLNTLLPNTLF